MNIHKKTTYREIMRQVKEDLEKTGAKTVDELDWNPYTGILFYSIGDTYRTFQDVTLPVITRINTELKR